MAQRAAREPSMSSVDYCNDDSFSFPSGGFLYCLHDLSHLRSRSCSIQVIMKMSQLSGCMVMGRRVFCDIAQSLCMKSEVMQGSDVYTLSNIAHTTCSKPVALA